MLLYNLLFHTRQFCISFVIYLNHFGVVEVSVPVSIAVHRGFNPRSGQKTIILILAISMLRT